MERNKLMEPTPTSSKSKAPLFIGLGLVLVVALVGAAFLAGRFFNQPAASTGPQGLGGPGGLVTGGAGGLGGDVMSVQAQVTPAPELPQLPPEVTGMFVSREDNRLFIGTCNMGMVIGESSGESSGDGPQVQSQGCGDGPQVEVVVTQETKVYRETTQPPDPSQQSGAITIQQTLAPGSVDELTSDSMVIVWGRRTGDRVIADVLLYSQPMIIRAPGP
jgi:hypothetical protein